MFALDDYQFDLPESHIAQTPAQPARSSRLLVCDHVACDHDVGAALPGVSLYRDAHFSDLPQLLGPEHVLFFNDTKVVPARVPLEHVRVVTHVGREVLLERGELFFLRQIDGYRFEGLMTLLKRNRPGVQIFMGVPPKVSGEEVSDAEGVVDAVTHGADGGGGMANSLHRKIDKGNINNGHDESLGGFVMKKNMLSGRGNLSESDHHAITVTIEKLTDQGAIFRVDGMDVSTFLGQYGRMPLPPYIADTDDAAAHYQTTFAQHTGSVAAPTASLHFDDVLLADLEKAGIDHEFVTLHVGLGTFKPVDTSDIRDYHIHEETIVIDRALFARVAALAEQAKQIVAVGTTVARTLETLPYVWKALSHEDRTRCSGKTCAYWDTVTRDIPQELVDRYIASIHVSTDIVVQTRIFIYPGFTRRIVSTLITNFHIPGSTLLMLVASAMGYDAMQAAYAHAIASGYRFYSFGDGMMVRIQSIGTDHSVA